MVLQIIGNSPQSAQECKNGFVDYLGRDDEEVGPVHVRRKWALPSVINLKRMEATRSASD